MAMNVPPPPKSARNSRVAERKRAEQELRDSEETLRMIAAAAQDAILMLDNDGRIALWNAAAERIFGYSSEEALGSDLHLLLAPARFHEAHRTAFTHFRSTGEGAEIGKTLELAALRKDGTEFPVELSLSAVKLKDKWCAIGIIRDIGERKRSEEQLRASEEQHRSLLAAMAEGVVLQDANGAVVMFNERAGRLLGLTAAQLTGGLPIDSRWRAIREDGSAFPGEMHPAMVTLKTGVPQSNVIMGVRKPDGAQTWISVNTQALVKPGQAAPDGVISSFRDITDHKTAEERLRLANAVAESSPSVLFRWRAAEGWPVEYVSSNVRQFGFTEEELLTGAIPFARMVYPEDMERVAAAVARYTAGGAERFAQEYRLVTKDGAVRWVDDRTTIERDVKGDVRYYQGVLTDITERKRAEEDQRTAALYTRSLFEASLDSLVTISAEGKITDVSKATEQVTGVARDRLVGTDFADYFTEPDKARAGYRQVLAEGYVRDYPLTIRHTSGRTTDVIYNASVYRNEAGELQGVFAAARDITERKRADEDRLAHLRFLESMDQIDRAIQGTNDFEKMLSDVIDAVLAAFACDRAWLIYPCDPDASSWSVPVERTTPEYPGANSRGLEIPMEPEIQSVLRTLTTADGPVPFGPASGHPLPDWLSGEFGVQSQLAMATYPRTGKPWAFGMHQCTHARVWTRDEQRLFREIGGRLTDALSSMLMQRDLRGNEAFLDAIVENIPDMIFVKEAQTLRFVRFNSAGERLLGYPRDELIGKSDYDLFPQEAADAFTAKDREVLARNELVDIPEEAVKTRVQGERFLHTKKIPIADKDGNPQYLLGISEDITERKQSQEALRNSEASLKDAQRITHIGNWDLDRVNDVLTWSEEIYRIFEIDPREFGTSYEAFVNAIHPGDREFADRAYTESVKNKIPYDIVHRLLMKDGRVKFVNERGETAYDPSGRPLRSIGTVQDITESKRAENALQKMNRALKATSNCNMALIQATDENQLLNEICRIIVESGGYRLAWVGYAEHDPAKTVTPVAHNGYGPGYMENTRITWADDKLGSGPVGLAIRSGQIQVVQDVQTDPRFEPWRANATRLGYGSVMVAPLLSGSKTLGALSIYAEDTDAFDAAEIALLSELAADMAFGITTLRAHDVHEQSAARLQRSMEATIQVIGGTVEMRDPYTAGHQRRVAELATAIAREMGLTDEQVHGLHLASVVHDLGKIHIPAEILSKPGVLSHIEFELIKTHPEAGYSILKGVDFPWPIAQIVLQHHERLDGSGYPGGLKGDEILREARILMVADVVEAMASHRPYRAALGIDRALQEINDNAGKYYDADVVQACTALFRDKAFAFTT